MRGWLLVAAFASGCSTRTEVARTPEITGTLSLGGTPLTVTACRAGRGVTTYVEAVTGAGVLRFEDRQLFWQADAAAVSRGQPLTCDRLDRSWGGGSRADGSAYWRGTLAFACTLGDRAVTGDLVLDCGQITAAERAQLDANRQDLREQQRSAGSGAASGSP